jgi:hypothetical protein
MTGSLYRKAALRISPPHSADLKFWRRSSIENLRYIFLENTTSSKGVYANYLFYIIISVEPTKWFACGRCNLHARPGGAAAPGRCIKAENIVAIFSPAGGYGLTGSSNEFLAIM